MQKTIPALVLACACICSCQGPSIPKPARQELRINIHSDPPSLDPRKPSDTHSSAILSMCFDGLIRKDSNGSPALAVAEQVQVSEDGKRYIFTLKNTTWSDGEPVKAQDFEQSWKSILDPTFPSEFAIDLYILKNGKAAKEGLVSISEVGVQALNDKTLIIDLTHPCPYFIELLQLHSFLPIPYHVLKNNPNCFREAGSHYVCNGPFTLTTWKHHNQIVLKKNQNYWDKDAVKLEKIDLYMIEDEMTELSMYENDELDWVGSPLSSLPIDALNTLSKSQEFRQYPMAGVYYYIFNTQAFPFSNVNIRKAFTIAINRKEIIDNITQANQTPSLSFIPPSLWGTSNEQHTYFQDGDVEEARRLFALGLKELGISKEQLPKIVLSYNTQSSHHKIAQAIKEQWSKAFGIRVHLENMEWKVFLDHVSSHSFQIARMGGIGTYNDPSTFLQDYIYPYCRTNHSQWGNQRFSELLAIADQVLDRHERLEILSEAEKIFMDEMPIAPIYFYTGSYLKKPYVKKVKFSHLTDVDFKYAYREL